MAPGGGEAGASPREISDDLLFIGTSDVDFHEGETLDLVVTPAGGGTSFTRWSSTSSSSGKARRRSALHGGEVSLDPSRVAAESYSSSSEDTTTGAFATGASEGAGGTSLSHKK